MDSRVIVFYVVFVIVSFVVFLILREVMCWYYKINEMVSLLKDIKAGLSHGKTTVSYGGGPASSDKVFCPGCGQPLRPGDEFCGACGAKRSLPSS